MITITKRIFIIRRNHCKKDIKSINNGTMTSLTLIRDYLSVENQPQALKTIVTLDLFMFNYIIDHIKTSGFVDRNYLSSTIKSICDLHTQMENYITQYFYEQENTLRDIQESHYNIIKQNPTAFKWGERRELVNKLKTDLGI